MRVVMMGTPAFSVPVLEALVAAGHEVVGVYCQPPRRSGRGKKSRRAPVHQRAQELGLNVYCPETLCDAAAQAELAALKADIAVVAAYGQILPQAVLDIPARGCLNIHASLLPRWRGAAPIHRAIMAGDDQTGVCIMQMEAGLDTGPVFACETTAIAAGEITADLHDRLSRMGAGLIVRTLAGLDGLRPVAQPAEGITYAAKIDKAEARVDWSRPATEVDRLIRGLSPFPGAWTEVEGERVKLLASQLAAGEGTPGEVIDNQLTVACGQGAVQLLRLQRAGGAARDAPSFLHGKAVPRGLMLK